MDLTELVDEIRSLHVKVDCVTETLSSLDKKVHDNAQVQQIESEIVRKSANSINVIVRLLAGLHKLTPGELQNTLVQADAILNTVNPINITSTSTTEVNPNNSVASTSQVEEDKIKIWRKYKNKYNYIHKIKPKLPPIKGPVKEVEVASQDDENGTVQHCVDPIEENIENSNDSNEETTYTMNDIMQNNSVYKMIRKEFKNLPFDDPDFRNKQFVRRVNKLGETHPRPTGHVKPRLGAFVLIKRCDHLLQNKKTTDEHFQSTSNNINDSNSNSTTTKTDEHFQSTSNSINDSNSNNTTAKMTKRETRANKTKDITNSTKVKTTTKKRCSTIKKSEYEPSKKKKN